MLPSVFPLPSLILIAMAAAIVMEILWGRWWTARRLAPPLWSALVVTTLAPLLVYFFWAMTQDGMTVFSLLYWRFGGPWQIEGQPIAFWADGAFWSIVPTVIVLEVLRRRYGPPLPKDWLRQSRKWHGAIAVGLILQMIPSSLLLVHGGPAIEALLSGLWPSCLMLSVGFAVSAILQGGWLNRCLAIISLVLQSLALPAITS